MWLTIVGISPIVPIYAHGPVPLERRVHVQRTITRQLLVVGPDPVPRRIWVGEHASLQHEISGGSDAGDHVAGTESGLLDVMEVVVGVPVEDEAADGAEGYGGMWQVMKAEEPRAASVVPYRERG